MSDKAEPALRILSDVVLHPTFKQEEIDRLKNQTLDGLRVALRQPGALSQFVAGRALFGDAPYGHSHTGTMETVQAIKRDDIVKLYQTYYVPENAALILSGNLTLEQGKKYAEQFFGGWKGAKPPGTDAPSSAPAEWKPSNIVVDMPEAGQAAVTVARPAIKRNSPDYYAGLVANAALGQWVHFAIEPRDPDQARSELRRPEFARGAARDRTILRLSPNEEPIRG